MKKILTITFLIMTSLLVFNIGNIHFSKNGARASSDAYVVDGVTEEIISEDIVDTGLAVNAMGTKALEVNTTESIVDATYGDSIILDAGFAEQATYVWSVNGFANANSADTMDCSSYDAGSYEVTCLKTISGNTEEIKFYLNISKAQYIFNFPQNNNIEYLLFDVDSYFGEQQIEDVEMTFFKHNGSSFTETNLFDIGEYKVEIALVAELDKNYELTNCEFSFNIVPTELTIEWDDQNTFTYTGNAISPSMMLVGSKYGYDVEVLFAGGSVRQAVNVGDYSIEIIGLSSSYFTFSQNTVKSFNWSIIPLELSVRWGTINFAYSGSNNTPLAYGYADGVEIPLDVKEVATGNTQFVGVNDYDIEAVIPSGYTGFVIRGNNTNVCSVEPKKLEIRYIGNRNYEYCGEVIEIGVEITSVISDPVTLTLSGNEYKDAGEYVARVQEVSDSNYYVDENDIFEWTISPKEIEVVWDDTLVFVFDGTLQWPMATAETGIDGERVDIEVKGELNVHANEDMQNGYRATASLANGETNYKLKNTSNRYWILRATPYFRVNKRASAIYTGGKLLPDYEFTGAEGSLVIKVNGLEIVGGIVSPGEYELVFTSKLTQDYNPISGDQRCTFTIYPTNLSSTMGDNDLKISAFNPKGLRVQELDLLEVDDFDKASIKTITKFKGYKYYRALQIGTGNYTFSQDTMFSFDINKIDGDRLRIFYINGDGTLDEKSVVIKDGIATITGGTGQYLLLVKQLNWWQNSSILTAIFVSVFVVLCVGVVLVVFVRPKLLLQENAIYRETKRRLKQKIESGVEISDDLIEKTREEVIKEREQKIKTVKLKKQQKQNGKTKNKKK